MTSKRRIILGQAYDPARVAELKLRLGVRWPPALYLYAHGAGFYLVVGPVYIGLALGSWMTQP